MGFNVRSKVTQVKPGAGLIDLQFARVDCFASQQMAEVEYIDYFLSWRLTDHHKTANILALL